MSNSTNPINSIHRNIIMILSRKPVLGLMAHVFNPSAQTADTGRSMCDQGQPVLCNDFLGPAGATKVPYLKIIVIIIIKNTNSK